MKKYTGLRDIHREKIYIGDILKSKKIGGCEFPVWHVREREADGIVFIQNVFDEEIVFGLIKMLLSDGKFEIVKNKKGTK